MKRRERPTMMEEKEIVPASSFLINNYTGGAPDMRGEAIETY